MAEVASVITVSVTDHEKVRSLFSGTARALEEFAALSETEKAALPAAARAGIDALADACRDIVQPVRDLAPYGSVILEWAPPRTGGRPMPGCLTSVYDTATGEQIFTVTRIRLIDVDANDLITADLTMYADEEGNPVAKPAWREDGPIMATFRFNVSEMRVREPLPGTDDIAVLPPGTEPVTP